MFKKLINLKKEKQVHPKVRTRQYINNTDEPRDNLSHDSLANNETILVENSMFIKQRFRGIAQKIRRIKKFYR